MADRPSARPIPVKPALAYLLAVGLIGPTAIFKGNNLLVIMLAVVLAMGVLSVLVSWLGLRRLEVRRMVPQWGVVGEPLRIRYQVRRRTRWMPSFGLRVADDVPLDRVRFDHPAWIMHVGPGEQVHSDARVTPLRRGRVRLRHIEVITSFPFGLIRRRRRTREDRDLILYPRRHQLRPGVLRASGADRLDGPRSGRKRGAGREWYGTRPAGASDSLRDIAWKLSAHRDDLVCLDRAAPSPTRIRVVLDLRRPTASLQVAEGKDPREEEERSIELAASIIQELHVAGCDVGLIVAGLLDDATPIRSSAWHVHRLMTRLADLDLDQSRTTWNEVDRADRSGAVVIQPGRVRPLSGVPDALYFTASQLDHLRVGGDAS
ncbi:MAG: DUF58 domain-containing protein [Phycisphaerales bacterium]|jgi:uncharacterized protein (DUF58 family)|nr:DUF58 domain-containing protein [Phycisphaerales bacterium]